MIVVFETIEIDSGPYYSLVGVKDCNESDPVYHKVDLLLREYLVVAGDIAMSHKERTEKIQEYIKDLETLGVEIEYKE